MPVVLFSVFYVVFWSFRCSVSVRFLLCKHNTADEMSMEFRRLLVPSLTVSPLDSYGRQEKDVIRENGVVVANHVPERKRDAQGKSVYIAGRFIKKNKNKLDNTNHK